ncbi:hypothetical protein [Phormidium sp. CCY1219]|uniref:hypothetical protein n=1 Tax=Phormidium sp. CCY1219 TaxID=2886104 RepID=UPI002D1F4A3F|nr:hypothetical protein [Phormidium sp. CCY1219]MEB3826520.1 hypothetical protein [Phormidium sp. CCY1219]
MNATLERAWELKQQLVDFVLDAEGDLAIALETYAAENASTQQADINRRNMRIDSFTIEGEVAEKTPLDIFIETEPDLSESDRQLIQNWKQSFMGLFEIKEILPDGFELMNWLTAKQYFVKPNNTAQAEKMARIKPGEILLTRIAPLSDREWMFFGTYVPMGKLGKPKLAVAVGNFKDNYKNHLYGDAPEMLEQAWESVKQYHDEFVEFFGSDRFTISGYELNKKLAELQEKMTQRRLEAAGIDQSKSFDEMAEEAGVDREEILAAAEEAGADPKEVIKAFENPDTSDMVTPKVQLPDDIKKAETVTCFSDPRWGQMFIPTYEKFQATLSAPEPASLPEIERFLRYYLEDPSINYYIWQQLAEEYPKQLENLVQTVLERPEFNLERDLESLLQEFNKPSEPTLPESASIPVHLHELFESALMQVHKSKSKSKGKKKAAKGFQPA